MAKKAKASNTDHYKTIPALASYIDRIGAEQLNFKRFILKEHKGHYYTEKCLVIIKKDFTIACTKKEYKPTDEEAAAIKEALIKVEWPKAITAKNINALITVSGAKKDDLFEFFDRKTGEISFVQEKKVNKDGSKNYLPWTFFSDGKWRMMEPDGALPFWKPKERLSAKIMIHEGAKAARYIHWLTTHKDAAAELKSHPWGEELKDYEHWGMIGGALAPHRADYDELKREKPIDVVYVCDNDWPGKKAIEDVSQCWSGSLKGVFFDERWPMSWDMADPFTADKMPRLFAKTGRYIGPALSALFFSATFATELASSTDGERGRPVIVMRKAFLEEWYHSLHPEVFINAAKPNIDYSLTEFNSLVAPFSHSKETGAIVKKDSVHKSAQLAYNAAKPSGIFIGRDGETFINMHVPPRIVSEKGDITLWRKYLDFMFPVESDRKEVERWCATLIACPGTKMHYGMLLISEMQGVGKTTLGQDILAPLVGQSNTSYPSESEIVESDFNYWSAQKRLAVVNEIYAGHSTKAYDKLKSMVTDKFIPVNKKYQSVYQIENWIHIFACSNSFRALKISDDDRRWFVPRVTEEKQDPRFWAEFHEWLEFDNGHGKIKWWAGEFGKKNAYVNTGDAAPWSTVKKEIVEGGRSAGLALVADTLDAIAQKGDPRAFVTDLQLQQYIKDKVYEGRQNDRLESLMTIRKLAKAKGWFVGEKEARYHAWGGGNYKKKMLFLSHSESLLEPSSIYEKGRKPIDLNGLEEI